MQTYPVGIRIGQYEIASNPMKGGMGVVYFALDHGNKGRPVAIKTFRPEFLPDRAARDRFLQECTAWVKLGSHPHIVRCYKVEYIDPTVYLVLELIDKEQSMPNASLRSWLTPGHPLPLEQALLFAWQIARGMQHATEKIPGFVHRDLKPENILVGADKLAGTKINRLRVTDFGLAKTIANSGGQSIVNNANDLKSNQFQFTRGVGTPLYMAPEQWKGEPVGVFTDVYAFGCILYEILSGQFIADGRTILEIEQSHCNGGIKLLPTNIPNDVANFVKNCLALRSNQRLNDWGKIINDLEHIYTTYSKKTISAVKQSSNFDLDEIRQTASSFNAIGLSYLDMGKATVALDYFEKALGIWNAIRDRQGEGAALCNLGSAYAHLGDARRALEYFEQALAIAREIGDRRVEGMALGNLGGAYRLLGDARRAISHYEQYLSIAHEIGDHAGEGRALGKLGNAYSDLGEMKRATSYYEQNLAIKRMMGNRRGEGSVLGNLGIVCLTLGDPRQALRYFEQSLAIAREIGDREGEGNALGYIGNAYHSLGEVRLAISFFEQALAIRREIGDRRQEALDLNNLGIAYADLHETSRAIELVRQALQISKEIGDIVSTSRQVANLGINLAKEGNLNEAISLLKQAIQDLHQAGYPHLALKAEKVLAELHSDAASAQVNPTKAAFEAFKRAGSLQEMKAAVTRNPILKDQKNILMIEDFIFMQVSPDYKRILERKLAWLKQIAEN